MNKTSYNMRALRGDENYSDQQFAKDMEEENIYIPEPLWYTPAMNDFVVEEMSKNNRKQLVNEINPETGKKFTEKEADKIANELKENAIAHIKRFYPKGKKEDKEEVKQKA